MVIIQYIGGLVQAGQMVITLLCIWAKTQLKHSIMLKEICTTHLISYYFFVDINFAYNTAISPSYRDTIAT